MTALLLGPQGEMSECKEETETREQEIRPWGSPGAGAEACWGMLWGAAPRGKENSPARQAAHKLETNPQPHRSPPQTTGQAGFCITLTFVPSHVVFKPQVWPICSCPVVRQAYGSGRGSKQPFGRVPAAPGPARSPPSNLKHPLSDQKKSPPSCPSHCRG